MMIDDYNKMVKSVDDENEDVDDDDQIIMSKIFSMMTIADDNKMIISVNDENDNGYGSKNVNDENEIDNDNK